MVAIVSGLFDSTGPVCGEYLPPSGADEVMVGLVISGIVMTPA